MAGLRREQSEGLRVTRTDDPEVTMIERRELRLLKSFDHCEHGSVDKTETQVGVPPDELPGTDVVGANELHDRDPAVLHLREELGERTWPEPSSREPVELDHDGRRNEQGLGGIREELRALAMVDVPAIHRSVEGTGVADQRHELGS